MKLLRPIALLFALLAFSSCFDITEEYWFKKDRSGRYEMSFDMSMMGSYQQMLQSLAEASDSTGQNPFRDTLLSMASLPDSVKLRLPHPELAERSKVALKMKSGFKMTFIFDFKEANEINLFWENFSGLDSLTGPGNGDIGAFGSMRKMFNSAKTSVGWQGKTFAYHAVPIEIPGMEDNPFGDMRNNPMLKMMLGSNTYTRRFHFDGKVKKVKGDHLKREGRHLVSSSHSLIDVLEDPTVLDCSIKLRR